MKLKKEEIYYAMAKKGINPKELLDLSHISPVSFYNAINKGKNVTPKTVYKIANTLNVSVEDISYVGGEAENEK